MPSEENGNNGLESCDVLIAESVSEKDSLHYRSRLCEMLFEKRNVSGVSFQYAPVLSCFSNARQTGLVIDMSGGGCTASAVLEGWCLTQTNVERSDLGGEELDAWLCGIQNGPTVSTDSLAKLESQRKHRESGTFLLPDGTEISQRVSKVLFDPTPLDHPATYVALHELVFTAATKQTSNEVRRALLNNVVVSGGLSRTEGVVQQLSDELKNMARMDTPRVLSCGLPQRHLTAWIGGSILSSLPVFKELCVSKAEFAESGPKVIAKKCA
jgi:actin-related protein